MMKKLKKQASSGEDRFPKIFFALSQYMIVEDDDSGELLSQSLMHVDERDELVTTNNQEPPTHLGKTRLGLQRLVTD
jgi:hypothetical protein